MTALLAAREAAGEGRGSVVLVTGEAGIGKTALVSRFAEDLGGDARVLWGGCDDLAIPRPLGPFRDLAASAAPALDAALSSETPLHRFHSLLFEELEAPPRPTVLVLEDVHWADEATLDAITVIGRRIAGLPAVLVLTYRSGEIDPGHPLNTVVGSIRTGTSLFLQLVPLSYRAVAALAGKHADTVYAATGGNPFYVTELIASLPEELPPSISNAVLGRVAKIDERSRRLLELVSMMPSRIPSAVLDAVMPGWEGAAEEPERRQLLTIDSKHVRFRHALASSAIRSSVPSARRRRLHAEILEALLAAGADPALIVHHAEEAGDFEALADHALLAARRAAAVESNREAYAHFRRAAEFAERLSEGEQAELFEELAVMSYTVGRLDDAFAAIHRAISLNAEGDNLVAEGRCHRLLSRFNWYAGNGQEAWNEGRVAVETLEHLGDSVDLAQAYSGLSQLAMLASHDAEAITWGTRALELAERLGDNRIRAHALINIGVPRTNADPDDTTALLEAFEVADVAGDRHEAVRALIALAWTYMVWIQPEPASRYTARGINYAEEHQVDTLLAYLNATDAWLRLRGGDWEMAEAAARREMASGVTVAQLLSATVLTELAVRRGDDDAAERLAEVREQADHTGELQRIGPVLELEMEWALTRDDPWPGRFEQVMENLGPGPRVTVGAARLAGWAAVAGLRHDFDRRMPVPHAAMIEGDWAGAAGAFAEVGWDYDRALMLSLLDDEQGLREALEIARSLGAAPLVGRVQRRMRNLGVTIPRGRLETTRTNPAGLTSRQVEVLVLLAEGLTNAEIADRLYVSPRTAEHHVTAVLAKLNVTSRREAARKATELRLVGDG